MSKQTISVQELAADMTGPLAVSADIYEAAEEAAEAAAKVSKEEAAAAAPKDASQGSDAGSAVQDLQQGTPEGEAVGAGTDGAADPENAGFEAESAGDIPKISRSWKDDITVEVDAAKPERDDKAFAEAQRDSEIGISEIAADIQEKLKIQGSTVGSADSRVAAAALESDGTGAGSKGTDVAAAAVRTSDGDTVSKAADEAAAAALKSDGAGTGSRAADAAAAVVRTSGGGDTGSKAADAAAEALQENDGEEREKKSDEGGFGGVGIAVGHDVLVHAERVVGQHVVAQPLEGVLRRHAPVGRAGRDDFHQRVADAVDLVLERLLDGLLRLADVLRAVHAHALQVRHAVQRAQQLADAHGVARRGDVAAVRRGLRDLVGQAGRGHLPAGHAVDGVVDEDDGDVLATVQRMDGLGRADAG